MGLTQSKSKEEKSSFLKKSKSKDLIQSTTPHNNGTVTNSMSGGGTSGAGPGGQGQDILGLSELMKTHPVYLQTPMPVKEDIDAGLEILLDVSSSGSFRL
ncbi:hypothetical protein HMI54_003884 [Coelomomyces lativittatus]|nr:hypothetical protein HMI54_003884 [Coelomomyces lativittatus]